jgi:hypothetical protein
VPRNDGDGYHRPQHMKADNEPPEKKLSNFCLPNQGQKTGHKRTRCKGPILTPTATAASVIRRMEIDKHPASGAACKKAAQNGPDAAAARCGRDQLELIKRRGYYPKRWILLAGKKSPRWIIINGGRYPLQRVDTFKRYVICG